ncbi:MAG: globin [Lacipirellulaceae bacterium]
MDISESLQEIFESNETLGKKFYKKFFRACPEAEKFFEGLDMHRQAVVLTMAFTLVEQFYKSPYVQTAVYFHVLGASHRDMGIPKSMFEPWLQTMLQTLAEFHGDRWDKELEEQWQVGLNAAAEEMFQGYDLPN